MRDDQCRGLEHAGDESKPDEPERAAVKSALATVRLPAGYRTELLGEATERAAAQHRLIDYGLAALVLILMLLQSAFNSWRLSLLEFLTLPMALVGGVIAAWAFLGSITLGALVGC